MTSRARPSAELLGKLADLASSVSGVALDAMNRESLERCASALVESLGSEREVEARMRDRDPSLRAALAEAIAVGETFFFRHPEHFELLFEWLSARAPDRPIRAWSAGCATGEEAYSLAAFLARTAPKGAEIVGTDLLASHVACAKRGVYRRWSLRESGPIAYPVVTDVGDGTLVVREEIRAMVRFEQHNLLDPTELGPFDVIFCRNVLLYFRSDAAELASRNLFEALAPEGLAVFGTMDPVASDRRLSRTGPGSVQAFVRRSSHRASTPSSAATSIGPTRVPRRSIDPTPRATASVSGASRATESAPRDLPRRASDQDSIEAHVAALAMLERGDLRGAERLLATLVEAHSEYLPGRFELAMLAGRMGHARTAARLMREVVDLTRELDERDDVRGPETLPVAFYRRTASAWLEGATETRGGRR